MISILSIIKKVSYRKLIAALVPCLIILIFLVFFSWTSRGGGGSVVNGFTGGDYRPEYFIYVSGNSGWNQQVDTGKYPVTLGSLLTTSNQYLIVHLIKLHLLENISPADWKKEGLQVTISDIEMLGDKHMSKDLLQFRATVVGISKEYIVRVDFSHDPDKITVSPI